MGIQPIETEYNGYWFRSRLEARWAVFFDAMGIDYEYEVQGYQHQRGRYLPDFKLTGFNPPIWFEVKGPPPTNRDLDNAYYMSENGSIAVIAHGDPYPYDMGGATLTMFVNGCPPYRAELLGCRRCEYAAFVLADPDDPSYCSDCDSPRELHPHSTDLMRAYTEARQKRFEYNDRPWES